MKAVAGSALELVVVRITVTHRLIASRSKLASGASISPVVSGPPPHFNAEQFWFSEILRRD